MRKFEQILPRWRLAILVIVLIGSAVNFFIKGKNMLNTDKKIKIGIGGSWISLHPGLQHTVYADMVLSNQFDSLVGVADDGQLVPLGATSWKVSDDFTKFEFQINTNLKFSDGSSLSSFDYKRSWEESLSLAPKSNNNSLADILYKVEGYEDFEGKKSLSGIETPSSSVLIIKFKSPFRMALDHLSGNRFSAYKTVGNGQFIGTGCYKIESKSEKVLILSPNEYNEGCRYNSEIELCIINPSDAAEDLKKGKIDVFAYGFSSYLKELPNDPLIGVISGLEASHEVLELNGIKGRFFDNPKFRLAFQYLIQQEFDKGNYPINNPSLLKRDIQIYLPYQQGRLEEEVVHKSLSSGRNYVDEFVIANKKSPLVMYSVESKLWAFDLVRNAGIALSEKSRTVTREELLNVVYKTNSADILPSGFSLSGSDPDNIYHALGRSGAIASEMSYRKRLADLLESGRAVSNVSELDTHYKKVSVAALEDVPFVHLGFTKTFSLYRKDKVNIKNKFIRRNFGHLNIYEVN